MREIVCANKNVSTGAEGMYRLSHVLGFGNRDPPQIVEEPPSFLGRRHPQSAHRCTVQHNVSRMALGAVLADHTMCSGALGFEWVSDRPSTGKVLHRAHRF